MKRFLITGSNGQIGTTLVPLLSAKYGVQNVIATDLKAPQNKFPCKFTPLDVTNMKKYEKIVSEFKINYIIHLASILSAVGEKNPQKAKAVNNGGTDNTLDLANKYKCTVFAPSSIAAFGDFCPKYDVPEDVILMPRSIYGVSKVYLELLGRYYHQKFDVDFRCIRYPGIISSEEYEYHGTTDYSTEIFFKALREKKYTCFLRGDTPLPMIHIDDAMECTLKYIEADKKTLTRSVYNLGGLCFTPKQLADGIKKVIPDFQCDYVPDFRQPIADSWPASLKEPSNKDFGWLYNKNVDDLVAKMFSDIKKNEEAKKAKEAAKKC
jgi:threonine 3-dehydrogenase